MAIALVLALLVARWVASTAPDFENLALGEQTFSIYGSYQGDKIFCGSVQEAPECLEPAKVRNLPKRVIWLGNSQLHAINQPKTGEKTAPVLLAEQLRPQGVEVQGFSFPSASLTEMALATAYLESAGHIDVLVVPLFLDDTREQGVREMLRPAVERPDLRTALSKTPTGQTAIAMLSKINAEDDGAESEDPSLQQKSETAITNMLEKCCEMQSIRQKARGQIEVQAFFLRNFIFNVTAQSVRPIIPAAYGQNMQALTDLLSSAKANGTRVILYIPPLRQDFKPPYDLAQYQQFKDSTKLMATQNGADWVDLDAIVPGKYWGTKAATRTGGDPELDFMHYQGEGHRLLAERMIGEVRGALK